MRYVSRKSQKAPKCFTNDASIEDRMMIANFFQHDRERLSQTVMPSSQFELDGDEVVASLSELFKGKCAFCESRTYINIHWFRPTSEAQPLAKSEHAHLYYVWLRTDWSNTYAACNECNSSAKRTLPVKGGDRGRLPTVDELTNFALSRRAEWPFDPNDKCMVIDPCRTTSMVKHLSFTLDGVVHALSTAGRATIDLFRLDRPTLQEARRRAFSDYIGLFDRALSIGDRASAFEFESLEFGGAWLLLIRQAIANAGNKLGRRIKWSQRDLSNTVLTLWSTDIGRQAMLEGFNGARPKIRRRVVQTIPRSSVIRQLSSIQLDNFKAIENLEIPLIVRSDFDSESESTVEATALVILGENAVGKSSVLEAVTLAIASPSVRTSVGAPPSSFILDSALLGAFPGRRAPHTSVTLRFADGESAVLRINEHDYTEERSGGMPPIFAYGAFRQYTARSSSRPNSGHVASLFRTDVLLPNPEQWLLGLEDDEFAMVARALKHIFVVEGEFDVIRRDMANKRCLIVSRVGDSNSEVITPLMFVSSGFRSVVGMVSDIFAGMLRLQKRNERQSFAEFSSIILIDEIEAHLHPRWKMQIISALRRTFPSSTIIATTHDPLCLRGLHPDEVVVLRQTSVENPASDKHPVKVEKLAHLPNVENLTVEQILTSDFFSMFSTDSAEVEERLARLGDLVSSQPDGASTNANDEALLMELKKEVVDIIPIGSTEVRRLILDAVHDYLRKRRSVTAAQLRKLREHTRLEIAAALEELL